VAAVAVHTAATQETFCVGAVEITRAACALPANRSAGNIASIVLRIGFLPRARQYKPDTKKRQAQPQELSQYHAPFRVRAALAGSGI
jgi:hypothetical protein